MCGRFTINAMVDEVIEEFQVDSVVSEFKPSYNIAPTQGVPVVVAGSRVLDLYKWGLIPHWAKDQKIGYKMINARSETIQDKPSFRSAFAKRRCLIIADGFYEWKRKKDVKIPYYITLDRIFAFAGIWETWTQNGKDVKSCSIVTCKPNKIMDKIHDRMPVILDKKDEQKWLFGSTDSASKLMKPYKGKMKVVAVSTYVNNTRNHGEECVKPVTTLGDYSVS